MLTACCCSWWLACTLARLCGRQGTCAPRCRSLQGFVGGCLLPAHLWPVCCAWEALLRGPAWGAACLPSPTCFRPLRLVPRPAQTTQAAAVEDPMAAMRFGWHSTVQGCCQCDCTRVVTTGDQAGCQWRTSVSERFIVRLADRVALWQQRELPVNALHKYESANSFATGAISWARALSP